MGHFPSAPRFRNGGMIQVSAQSSVSRSIVNRLAQGSRLREERRRVDHDEGSNPFDLSNDCIGTRSTDTTIRSGGAQGLRNIRSAEFPTRAHGKFRANSQYGRVNESRRTWLVRAMADHTCKPRAILEWLARPILPAILPAGREDPFQRATRSTARTESATERGT